MCGGIKRLHLHLYGERFVLQADHEPLEYIENSAKFVNSNLMHWAMLLQSYSYNLKVEAIKGSDNADADCPS